MLGQVGAKRSGESGAGRPKSGQSVVELALMMPLIALLLVGVVDLGRMFFCYTRLTDAVKEGALFAIHSPSYVDATSSSGSADPQNIKYQTKQEARGALNLTDGDIIVTCYSGTSASVKPCSSATSGDTVKVSATYAFVPITTELVSFFGTSWTLRKSATMMVI